MVGCELIKTIGSVTATFKFTPKYTLKAGQKVMVRPHQVFLVKSKVETPSENLLGKNPDKYRIAFKDEYACATTG